MKLGALIFKTLVLSSKCFSNSDLLIFLYFLTIVYCFFVFILFDCWSEPVTNISSITTTTTTDSNDNYQQKQDGGGENGGENVEKVVTPETAAPVKSSPPDIVSGTANLSIGDKNGAKSAPQDLDVVSSMVMPPSSPPPDMDAGSHLF